jgi:5-methylcytosine-specific restriction endonuclease McrA
METLVLNRSYQPVARVGWQRAVTLVLLGKVELVETYENKTVRSVSLEFKVPSVVRFLRKLTRHKPVVRLCRATVFVRDRGRCQYCHRGLARAEATFDHVIPRAQGGVTSWENIVIACVPCNQRKAGRTPEQARMRLSTRPQKPTQWPDTVTLTLMFQKGMPSVWRPWLRGLTAWHVVFEGAQAD